VETIGHFPLASDQPHKKSKVLKNITFTLQCTKRTQKKRLATMLIATPDEIIWKGLEMGGFNHRQQQRVKQDTCLW
jgi:hypothetical protein